MADDNSKKAPSTAGATPPTDPPANEPKPVSVSTPLFGGTLTGTGSQPSPKNYLLEARYLFMNGDELGSNLKLSLDPKFSIDQYGFNGKFGLDKDSNFNFSADRFTATDTWKFNAGVLFNNGDKFIGDFSFNPKGQNYGASTEIGLKNDGKLTAGVRVDEATATTKLDTNIKLGNGNVFAADWNKTREGQIYGANAEVGLKGDGKATGSVRVDEPAGTIKADTKFTLNNGNIFAADWNKTREGQIYGANAEVGLKGDGKATGSVRVDEPAGTIKADTKFTLNNGNVFAADWNKTPEGDIYGANTSIGLKNNGNAIGSVRVDEVAGTTKFDTQFKLGNGNVFNADLSRTRQGDIYGANTEIGLKNDGKATGSFRVDEPAGTAKAETKLNFGSGNVFAVDWNKTREGQNYGASAEIGLKNDGKANASFRVDETTNTTKIDAGFKLGNGTLFNADWSRNPNGQIYGANTEFNLDKKGSKFEGNFRVNEPEQSLKIGTRLLFANGDEIKGNYNRTTAGQLFDGSGNISLGNGAKGSGSFSINEIDRTSNFKLGATLANGSQFNTQLSTSQAGTALGADAKFNFNKGAGSIMLDGKFGPSLFDAGLSVSNKTRNFEYSGTVRANNESGQFRLSEVGAKISTTENSRHRLSLEAGYKLNQQEPYAKLTYSFSFGGGGGRSSARRVEAPALPSFDGPSAIDRATNDFKQKQSLLLQPENKLIYDSAIAGVKKLNAEGANLTLANTATSLLLLAKQNGMQSIGNVELGKPNARGEQNLFISEASALGRGSSAEKIFINADKASNTPASETLQTLQNNQSRQAAAETATGLEQPAQNASGVKR
jgi:hypothetical protein